MFAQEEHKICFACVFKPSTYIVCTLGVSPNFEITVACDLKFHWYLRTLRLKFQKATNKIETANRAETGKL